MQDFALDPVGREGTAFLAGFGAALVKGNRRARGTAGARLSVGEIVVLKMPNAHADAALDGERPMLAVTGAAARLVVLGHGGNLLADRIVGAGRGRRGEVV